MEIKLKIEEILKYTQPTKFIASEIIEKGNVPVLTANKSFVIGYTNEEENIFSNVPCIIFDDFTCDMKYVDFPFKIRSSAIKILNLINNENNIKYIYELIKKIKFDNIDHKRYWISEFSKQQISLIDINKQKMIGNFLSNIDKKIEKIKDGIKIIEEYKKIFLNNIFSNNNHNKEKLFDVSKKIKSGGTPLSSNKSYYGNGYKFAKINDLTSQGKYVNDTEISITEEGFNNSSSWLIPKNNLLYSMYASIGFPAINKIDIVTNQAIAGIILDKDKVDLNFIYYFLLWNRDRVLRMVDLGVQGNLNIETIKNIKIPLIDLMKQELISEFLSNIDKKVDIFNLKLKHLIKNKFVILDKIFN